MKNKSWAKGRKQKSYLVRLEPSAYGNAKIVASYEEMTMKAWISELINKEIEKKSRKCKFN